MSTTIARCPTCHNLLGSTYETATGQCVACHLFPRTDACPMVLEAPFSAILAKHYVISIEARANGSTWAASAGYSVEAELREVGPEPSDVIDPKTWIDRVRSGDIPPHDGRRCLECGFPLDEQAHNDGYRPGWLLCPCCDTYNTGDVV